ncbi:2-amino-4-hydroxy-6-hydroxymethyldihydropteridine diphosphokinase [Coralliovum pocilloporae]|uniref:2-amino-4-hydroxy-6- hydroxymethyldihydropteridine diphosphokinase n=1 Tax=Coralliovum pocilloporae TaxID=3066369 RepID=UPI003307454F
MTTAILGLGSNIGDKIGHLNAALEQLDGLENVSVVAVSRFYQTAPWGYEDQDWFVNACVLVETDRDAEDLLDRCLDIEKQLGRERSIRWGPRIIDIDVLTYGDDVIETDRLQVPHPRILERAFVLVPMRDVMPGLALFSETLDTHLSRLEDRDEVIPVK